VSPKAYLHKALTRRARLYRLRAGREGTGGAATAGSCRRGGSCPHTLLGRRRPPPTTAGPPGGPLLPAEVEAPCCSAIASARALHPGPGAAGTQDGLHTDRVDKAPDREDHRVSRRRRAAMRSKACGNEGGLIELANDKLAIGSVVLLPVLLRSNSTHAEVSTRVTQQASCLSASRRGRPPSRPLSSIRPLLAPSTLPTSRLSARSTAARFERSPYRHIASVTRVLSTPQGEASPGAASPVQYRPHELRATCLAGQAADHLYSSTRFPEGALN